MIDVDYKGNVEEFRDQIEGDVKKYFDYNSDDKEIMDKLDNFLESKQMTIESFRNRV